MGTHVDTHDEERLAHFRATTFTLEEADDIREAGFTFRTIAAGRLDDGEEFVRLVQIFADGERIESEFAHRDAYADAGLYVRYAFESAARNKEADRLGVHPLELELGPFGPEWQREQDERRP